MAQIYNAHPTIYFDIASLKEMQTETDKKVYSKLFQLEISKKLSM